MRASDTEMGGGVAVRVLLLGVGNILLSDEGVGVKVIEQLEARYSFPPEVTLVDGGTMGLELLPYFEECSHLFLLDAIRGEAPPGTLEVSELADPPAYFRQKISPHQIGLSEVLAVASLQECLPALVKLFGIVPEDLSTGLSLSASNAAAVEAAVAAVLIELANLGLSASPRV